MKQGPQMIRRTCSSCSLYVLHNPCAPKNGGWRCTYCGSPISTNVPSKRELQEEIRQKQVNKARARLYT